MPRKLEDILKAKGLTDADIANMSTLLTNPSYRTALEASYSELETERDSFKQRDQEWVDLRDQKYVPALTAAEEDARKARLEAAELRERVKIAKEYGYLDDKNDPAPVRTEPAAQPQSQGFNPEDPKFREFANRFSTAEGDAMALYGYISEEYRLLNGGSINDYRGQNGQRGLPALRAEALAARKPIDVYASEKFNWDGKRAEADQRRSQEHDDTIRRETEQKIRMEYAGNPMVAPRSSSRNPFIPPVPKEGGQPWERSAQERRSARIQNATQTQLKAQSIQ